MRFLFFLLGVFFFFISRDRRLYRHLSTGRVDVVDARRRVRPRSRTESETHARTHPATHSHALGHALSLAPSVDYTRKLKWLFENFGSSAVTRCCSGWCCAARRALTSRRKTNEICTPRSADERARAAERTPPGRARKAERYTRGVGGGRRGGRRRRRRAATRKRGPAGNG